MRSWAILAVVGLAELVGPIQAGAQTAAPSAAPAHVTAVYELFTSQGCSSCPRADAILARLAKRDDVIALTFPVDVWDYLGWRDTLARPEFTDRQRAYARKLGDGMVYTPQGVVSGLMHVNGGYEEKIEGAIEKTGRAFDAVRIPVGLSTSRGRLVIDVASAPAGGRAKEATVWVASVASSVEVPVTRGENQGRTLAYANVVRRLMPIGTWSGSEMVVRLDRRSFMDDSADRCAVLLQQGLGGPIIGAALLDGM